MKKFLLLFALVVVAMPCRAHYPCPSNEIWYTNGSTTGPTNPSEEDVFGVNIISNTYDSEKECWVIKFDGDVTTIGRKAFSCCSRLTRVTIPDSVTTIGNCAFSNCSSLTSVTIGDSVTKIGYEAFGNCSSLTEFRGKYASEDGRCLIIDGTLNSFAPAGLTEYTIPDSVTKIREWAFAHCSSLTSVTIPDSVTSIRNWAFACCSSLTSVYCKATTPPAGGSDMFSYNASGRKIYVPTESVEAYKSALGWNWNDYADDIEGYNF